MSLLDESHEYAQQVAEAFSQEIYTATDGVAVPNGYATFKIDMSLMTAHQRRMVYEAERCLRLAGVSCDVNSGNGFRNWELDWSLSGATLQVRPIVCSHITCIEPVAEALWSRYLTLTKRMVIYAYCSASHRDKDERRLVEAGWLAI